MITPDAECLKKIEKYQPDYVVYRNKEDKEYAKNAKLFVNICREFQGLKVYLHRDYLLASELGADGVHLTSTQFDDISLAKAKDLEVIISTHNLDEVKKAQNLGVDAVTYSPIFYSQNKGNPKATVAGLVTMLADAYRTQMDHTTLMYNDIAWSLSGVPVILNGDSAKHYQELKHYQPETCVIEVNSFIRERAMEERFESILKDKEDEQ